MEPAPSRRHWRDTWGSAWVSRPDQTAPTRRCISIHLRNNAINSPPRRVASARSRAPGTPRGVSPPRGDLEAASGPAGLAGAGCQLVLGASRFARPGPRRAGGIRSPRQRDRRHQGRPDGPGTIAGEVPPDSRCTGVSGTGGPLVAWLDRGGYGPISIEAPRWKRVAPLGLSEIGGRVVLGLPPQATQMSPLRGELKLKSRPGAAGTMARSCLWGTPLFLEAEGITDP